MKPVCIYLPADLADKLREVLDAEGLTTADFLEPLVRVEIENRHRMNMPAVVAMRAARERVRQMRDEGPELANELGDPGA